MLGIVLGAIVLAAGGGSRSAVLDGACVADAGNDVVIEAGKTVRLDGTESKMAESFSWSFLHGPSITASATRFEAPADWSDEYGTRMRGWVHPPVTGKYRFWLASDDNGELWLSKDDTSGRKRLIARVEDWTKDREWDKHSSQRSKRINLVAGRAYYIEALQKEWRGGDNLAVAWAGPALKREVVPGRFLSETADGKAGSIIREVWTGLPGGAISDLTSSPAFSGELPALAGADTDRPSFVMARPGTYELKLDVTAGGRSASDRVKVRVIPETRPSRIVVDPKRVRGKINPLALGINVNYLVDNDANREKLVQTFAEALRELGVTILRFPGGDKSDDHLWSVPPFEKASPKTALAGDWDWPAMDKRLFMPDRKTWKTVPFDFDQYMALVRTLGIEATVVVPVDAGFQEADKHHESVPMQELVRTAVEWVKYAKKKGFPVRYWEIGNESYFHVSADRYAHTVMRFATAMREVDPGIRIGVVGMPGERVGKHEDGKVPWNKVVLERTADLIDYVIIHEYPNYGWKSYEGYLDRDPDFTSGIRDTRKAIDAWAPKARRGRIKIALTEYGGIDYAKPSWANVADLGHSLLIANMIGQYLGEPDLDAALMWNTRWVDNSWENLSVHDALAPDNSLTAVGRALAIWARFCGTEMLEVADGASLKVFATSTSGTGALSIMLINKGMSEHDLVVEAPGTARTAAERWQLTGKGPGDRYPEFKPVDAVPIEDGRLLLKLPPVSLTVLVLQ